MKKDSKVGLTIIVLAALALILWFFMSGQGKKMPTELPVPELIKTAKPLRMNFELKARWIGESQAKQKVTIVALEEGIIISVDANDEAMVNKGAALFALGGPVMEAKLVAAGKKVASLQNRLGIIQDTLARKQEAAKEKIVSLDELDSAKSALEQIKAELDAAKEQLQLLQDAAHITAPISGIFTNRKINVGQTVEKGQELSEVIVPGKVRIVATVFAYGISGLEGRPVTFYAPDGKLVSSTIAKVLPERTAAGYIVVWIESGEIDEQIKPGQNLSGEFIAAVHNDALSLPTSSVVYDENENAYVFLKIGDKFEKKPVRVGLLNNDRVEMISGVTQQDEVVTEGAYELYYRDFNKSYKVSD
jgi:RND family efflux transporter MFP subunit